MTNEIKKIKQDLKFVKDIYLKLLTILPSFDITDSKILPYGLKAHTRSVSWLVEQVITQQTKYNAKKLGLDQWLEKRKEKIGDFRTKKHLKKEIKLLKNKGIF